jgi:serine/tyrosine/threonine adenylyltransferase
MMPKMLDYTINTFFPHIDKTLPVVDRYSMFYGEVLERTAKMAAAWQVYGFCHGVLNTDNMSIVGVTIDYGPYGFLEHYNPKYICNSSDTEGRYRYEA